MVVYLCFLQNLDLAQDGCDFVDFVVYMITLFLFCGFDLNVNGQE
jgi:hypothetical protein